MTAHFRMRSSSRPAAAKAASLRSGDVQTHPVRKRVPEVGRDVVLRLAEHRLRIDREEAACRAEDVVVVEVSVHERRPPHVETRVQLPGEWDELVPLRVVQPARDVVADPAERLAGGPPELQSHRDCDCGRLLLLAGGDVVAGKGTFDQQGAPVSVSSQQAHDTRPVPERECVRLLVRLVVLRRRHLQDGAVTGRRRVRIAGERERLAELDSPLRRDLARGRCEGRRRSC